MARLVAEPPSCVQTAKVRELLLVVPRIGPARADRVLARCRIAHAKTVGGLSDRQPAYWPTSDDHGIVGEGERAKETRRGRQLLTSA